MNAPDPIDDLFHAAELLIGKALPKFNWGASALDAEAIETLNEFPLKLTAAVEHRAKERRLLADIAERERDFTRRLGAVADTLDTLIHRDPAK